MVESLLEHTAGIRRRVGRRIWAEDYARGRAGLFAHDTRAALLGGARHAAAALINDGRYYEASQVLRQVQGHLRFDVTDISGKPSSK